MLSLYGSMPLGVAGAVAAVFGDEAGEAVAVGGALSAVVAIRWRLAGGEESEVRRGSRSAAPVVTGWPYRLKAAGGLSTRTGVPARDAVALVVSRVAVCVGSPPSFLGRDERDDGRRPDVLDLDLDLALDLALALLLESRCFDLDFDLRRECEREDPRPPPDTDPDP